jgi:ABC-type lipoprotein release transport system permease subunit
VAGGALVVAMIAAVVPAVIAANSRPTGALHAE